MSQIVTIDPRSGDPIDAYAYTTPVDLDATLDRLVAGARRQAASTEDERAAALLRLASILEQRAEDAAQLITLEMGKPISQARGEVAKCIATCRHYAAALPQLSAPRSVDVGSDVAYVHPVPIGVVLAIMPWNYPFWQVFRAMIPALAMGNTAVLKHADNVTGSALAVAQLINEAFGYDALHAVVLPPERIGALIDDRRVAAVAFTGSNRVGAIVAARAGAAVKKTVLELGGSDPYIVLDDADLARAAEVAVSARFANNGQSCIAGKRFIVARSVSDEFTERFVAGVQGLAYGDPTIDTTFVGPMARVDLRDELDGQFASAVEAGADVLVGGERSKAPGAWFEPTVVRVDARAHNRVWVEETFGPLGALTVVDGVDEAIGVADASIYGLSASLWTDPERARALVSRIEAGAVFVNRMSESDPRLEIGGTKASGYGRELGFDGAMEFVNRQSVRISGS